VGRELSEVSANLQAEADRILSDIRSRQEARVEATRTTAQLSARERSKVTDAMIDQIGALTQANNELNARLVKLKADYDGHRDWLTSTLSSLGLLTYNVTTDTFSASAVTALERSVDAQNVRIDEIERDMARANTRMFWARLRWLVVGR